jgi:branched-chain amino acid aminotransferase
VAAEKAAISVFDRGLRWGDAVYDVERTFRHKVFRLRDHMLRLERSLRYARIEPPLSIAQIEETVEELVRRNSPCIVPESDMDVVQIITRGTVDAGSPPNIVMYCKELEWARLARDLRDGVRCVISSTRRIPHQCLSPNAKIANKMSQMVAEQEVKALDPEARALMLDIHGNLAEEASANLFFAAGGRLFTPSLANCLPGISRRVTMELAAKLGLAVEEGVYAPFNLLNADEAFLTSTSPCLFGVTHVSGARIGKVFPGPLTRRLTEAWKELVGLDFVEQACRQAARGSSVRG